MRKVSIWALLLALVAACAAGQMRGFRPNGLDLDDDGVIDQNPLVCDSVGGTWDAANQHYREDVDGDGELEEQVFVHGTTGTDGPNCGSPTSPCKTVAFAESLDDGVTDLAEPIVCMAGDIDERLHFVSSGVPGFKYDAADSAKVLPVGKPSNGAMYIGWDEDDDGVYPPADADDTCRLTLTGGFQIQPSITAGDFWEMAHCRSFRPGHASMNTSGWLNMKRANTVAAGDTLTAAYIHDWEVEDANWGNAHIEGAALWITYNSHWTDFTMEYVTGSFYGYLQRGGPFGGKRVRLANNDLTQKSLGNAGVDFEGRPFSAYPKPSAGPGGGMFRFWGSGPDPMNGYELIRNNFRYAGAFDRDGNPVPIMSRGQGGAGGIALVCMRDLRIAENDYFNTSPFGLSTGDGICNPNNGSAVQSTRDYRWLDNRVFYDDPATAEDNFFFAPLVSMNQGNNGPQHGQNVVDGLMEIKRNYVYLEEAPLGSTKPQGGQDLTSVFLSFENQRAVADYTQSQFEIWDNVAVIKIGQNRNTSGWGTAVHLGPSVTGNYDIQRNQVIHLNGRTAPDVMVRVNGQNVTQSGNQGFSCNSFGADCTAAPTTDPGPPPRPGSNPPPPPPDPCSTDPGGASCCTQNPNHASCDTTQDPDPDPDPDPEPECPDPDPCPDCPPPVQCPDPEPCPECPEEWSWPCLEGEQLTSGGACVIPEPPFLYPCEESFLMASDGSCVPIQEPKEITCTTISEELEEGVRVTTTCSEAP